MRRKYTVLFLVTLSASWIASCQQPAEPAPPPQRVESAADKAAKIADTNKAVFMKFMDEVASKGEIAMIDEVVSPEFVEHQEVPPGTPPGVEGLRQFLTGIRVAFPDLTVSVNEIVASGDMVAARSTWTGTQQSDWMGMKPSGSPLTFEAIDIVRFQDGKVAEHWGLDNSADMMMRAMNTK